MIERIPHTAEGEPAAAEHRGPSPATEPIYRLPNNPPLTERDFKRYHTSLTVTDTYIRRHKPDNIYKALEKRGSETTYIAGIMEIDELPESERAHILEEAMATSNWRIQQAAIENIPHVPEHKRTALVYRALFDVKKEIALLALKHLEILPESNQELILKQGLGTNNTMLPAVKAALMDYIYLIRDTEKRTRLVNRAMRLNQAMPMFGKIIANARHLTPEQLDEIVRAHIKSDDPFEMANKRMLLAYIQDLPPAMRPTVVRDGMNDKKRNLANIATNAIQYLPADVQQQFLHEALDHPDDDIKEQALGLLDILPDEEERAHHIREALGSPSRILKLRAIRNMRHLPESERRDLAHTIMFSDEEHADEDEQAELLKRAEHIPEALRIACIKHAMNSPFRLVRVLAVEHNAHLKDENEQVDLVRRGLFDENETVRWAAQEQLKSLPTHHQITLINEYSERGQTSWPMQPITLLAILHHRHLNLPAYMQQHISNLKSLATNTPLYHEHQKPFTQKKFSKTGTATTLLDVVEMPGRGAVSLRERVIVRHIPAYALDGWRSAYEATEVWRKHGFDYVPIEPIVSVKPSTKPLGVSVYTRVIPGPSMQKWLQQDVRLHENYLRAQQKKILAALAELGINHGHPHLNNFVLYFERDEKGEPDITKPPRVYMIDFDQATSPSSPSSSSPSQQPT